MEAFITELSWFFRWLLISTMQVSVLVCLIFVVKAMVRGRLAVRWHYWLWLLLLIRMVIPWAPESNFSVFTLLTQAKNIIAEQTEKVTPQIKQAITPKVASIAQGLQSVTFAKATSQSTQLSAGTKANSFEVIHILSLLWLGIALALGIFALGCNFRLWRIIKSKRPITAGRILNLLEDCKAQMNVQTILGIVITDRVKSPALFGVIRPRLLLPEGMLEKLDREQLRYVFLHELGHLKRNDVYLGWLMVILQILHWFNPLVWLAFGRMRTDRELACDGLVLSAIGTGESQTYGQTLVNLFKGFTGLHYAPGIAGILENKSQLKRRITMIAQFKKGSYRWSVLAIVLLAVLGSVALTNAQTAKNSTDLNAKVANIDIDNAVLEDVIEVFGEPLKYAWGQETIPKEKIPADHYCMIYPDFSIMMRQDSIGELRFNSPAAGYVFNDEIRVGSSLDEVLAALGEPVKTVEGKSINWTDTDGVLYMDVGGEEGSCYYHMSDWNVRMFFANYKVVALYVLSESSSDNKVRLREEDLEPTSYINEDGHIVDKVDYPFVNDPEAIGYWECVDYVRYIEDFNPNKQKHKGDLFLKELFIRENGKTNQDFTWTKGLFLDVEGKEASKYVIEEIDGAKYLFFEWKTGDYKIYHIKPKFCVLKKMPDKVHVESRTYDKVDYPFVDDPEAIGTWEAIDYVETPAEFNPRQKQWPGGELFVKEHIIYPDGKMFQLLCDQAVEEQREQLKRLSESFLKELGVDPDGQMSQILDKSLSEFDQASVKTFGEPFLKELSVDGNMKLSEFLNKDGDYLRQAREKGFSESLLSQLYEPETSIRDIINNMIKERARIPLVWTKGLIISKAGRIASRYYIQEIEGSTYMFYEWKTGDYVLRQKKPKYFVLKKK